MITEENIVQDQSLSASSVAQQAGAESFVQTSEVAGDPPNKKIYNYLVGLYKASNRRFSETNLNSISSLENVDDLKYWVNTVRTQNNLPNLSDTEFISLNADWTRDLEDQKKKDESLPTTPAGQTSTTALPSTSETEPGSSESEQPEPPNRYVVYEEVINGNDAMLAVMKNFRRDFLTLNEEDAYVAFKKQFGNFGFSAEVTGRGENTLLVTRPDGSQFEQNLMSDLGDKFYQTVSSDDYNLRLEQRHNEFLYTMAVEGGGQHMVPVMASEFRANPMAIPQTIRNVVSSIARPPEDFLQEILTVVSGKPGMSTDLFYTSNEFDESKYAAFLYAAQIAIEPEHKKAVQFIQSIKDNPKTTRGGTPVSPRDPRQRDEYIMTTAGRVRSSMLPDEVLNTTKVKSFLDAAIDKYEAQRARGSILASHGLRASGAFENIDYTNIDYFNELEQNGLSRHDVPLSALKINGETATFREMYELVSSPLELSYVRNGEFNIEIDKDADLGEMFNPMIQTLARLQENNNAKFDPDNPRFNEFARQVFLIPAELRAYTYEMLHHVGMALDDPLSAIMGPEASKFILFEEFGVVNGRGLNIQKPNFPSSQSVARAKEGLPEYDYSITNSRDIAEFLILGKSAAIQSFPHTATFLLNPYMGLALTGTTTYGRSREELMTAREEAREMQAAGINLSPFQKEMIEMSDGKIRAISAAKGITDVAITGAFTFQFYKGLHQGLNNFKNFKKSATAADLKEFSDAYARRYREGLINSFARTMGLSKDALSKEIPEEMMIAFTHYMVDVAAGVQEWNGDTALQLAMDAGINSLFTSLPMGAAKNQLTRGINQTADNIITSNITMEGETANLQTKANVDFELERLNNKGVKPNNPRVKILSEEQARLRNLILRQEEEKKALVDSMSNSDKAKYLNIIQKMAAQEEAIFMGGKPEMIDAHIKAIEGYRVELNQILSKYPSRLGYFFLSADEQNQYKAAALDALKAKYKEGENYKITPEEVDEKASELFLEKIKNDVAPFTPVASAREQFYQAEDFYTTVTPEQKADFNLRDNIARARQSNLFEQPANQEQVTPVEAEVVQEQPTIQEPTKPQGKTIDQFINRGAQFKDPVTGEVLDGDVYLDGQTVVFEEKKTGKIFELGNAEEISGTDAADSGIVYKKEPIGVKPDGTITVNGKEYMVQYDLVDSAIEYNPDGSVKAVSLKEKGTDKRVMLTGQDAEDAAMKIKLSTPEDAPPDVGGLMQMPKPKEQEADEFEPAVIVEDQGAPEVNSDIDRKNQIVDRIEALNKSNDFYNNLSPLEQNVVVEFFNDIIKGRRPRFGKMENVVRGQELAYELSALNNGKIRIFKDKFKNIRDDGWKRLNIFKYNPIETLKEFAQDLYPMLNDFGRKQMTGMIWNFTGIIGFDAKESRKNMVTGDILKDALFQDQRLGKPFISLWNTANQNTAIALNISNDAITADDKNTISLIQKYNSSLPVGQANQKITYKNGGLDRVSDYELQVLSALRRQTGEINPTNGLDSEFSRQKNSILKELELRKAEYNKNKSDETAKDRYLLLQSTVDRLGLREARSYDDVAAKARKPIIEIADRLASRFPHDQAQQRKLDYDGQSSFFVKGTYLPTFRVADDGEMVTDGRRVTRSQQEADVLKDVTMDEELKTSRLSFGGYYKRAYQALTAANVDIYSRAEWDTFDKLVNSKVFEDMFEDPNEYNMIKSYYGSRWAVFERLLNTQNAGYDVGDASLNTAARGWQATYTGVTAVGLGGVGQPPGQFFSAQAGSMATLTDPVAKSHALRGGYQFPLLMADVVAGQDTNNRVSQFIDRMLGKSDLSNIYAKSRTNLRSALKAEYLISDDALMPMSFYAKAFNMSEQDMLDAGFTQGKYRLNQALEIFKKGGEATLNFFIANADGLAANVMFEAHYIQARVDQGERLPQDMKSWWAKENENPNLEAIQKADQRIAETMRQTTEMSEAQYYGMDSDAMNNVTKNLLYSWGKFQINYKSNFANQYARYMNPDIPEIERQDAGRRLNGLMREAALFHGIKLATDNYTVMGLIAGMAILFGAEEEDIRRYDDLSMANLINGALLPNDDPRFIEMSRTLSKNEINTMEAFKLMLQEDTTGLSATMLELHQAAHEYNNKSYSSVSKDFFLQTATGLGTESFPSPIPPEVAEIAKYMINKVYGDEVLPEYISRDLERAGQSQDETILAFLDNIGIVSVGLQQIDNLRSAFNLMQNQEYVAPLTSGGKGGSEVSILYAPNETMQKQLDTAVNILFQARVANVLFPGIPRKDMNKLLNKLERQIEKNFTVAIPNYKNAKSEFVKFYIKKRKEQGALIDDRMINDDWWKKERQNLNLDARKYAVEEILKIRKQKVQR